MVTSKKIILGSLILTAFLLNAAKFTGHIFEINGKALENAIITCEGKIYLSDIAGRFTLKEAEPDSEVIIHKIGYNDLTFTLKELPTEVFLHISAIQLEGTKVYGKTDKYKLPEGIDKTIITMEDHHVGNDLADLLRKEAGLQISGTNLTGEAKFIIIPGYKAKHTQVMVDGIVLNKPGEAFDISNIPAEIVDNVEIYDSSSLTEGSGSMAGIVNINLKKNSRKPGFTVTSGSGSFGMNSAVLTLSVPLSSTNLFMALSHRSAKNDFKYEAKKYWEQPDSLRTRRYNDKALFDLNFHLNNYRFFLPFSYTFYYQDIFKKLPGPTNNPELYEDSRLIGSVFRNTLNLNRSLGNYNWDINLYYFYENTEYDNTRIDDIYHSYLDYYVLNRSMYRKKGLESTIKYDLDKFDIGLGLDLNNQSFEYREYTDNEDSIPEITENYVAVKGFMDHEMSFYPFSLKWQASGRIDHFDQDDQISYNVNPEIEYGSVFILSLGCRLSRGFTVPSFYELYWKGDTQAVGNPDLRPEVNNSNQLYLKLTYSDSFLRIGYRKDEIVDMIVWFPDFNKTWKPMNISGADVNNLLFQSRITFNRFVNFETKLDITDAIDRSLSNDGGHTSYWGTDIIYTPEYLLNTNLNFFYENFILKLNYSRTGEQWPTRDQLSNQLKLPAYDLINVDIGYMLQFSGLTINVGLKLNNLFDKMYEIYEYSPQPGFNWELNLKIKYTS